MLNTVPTGLLWIAPPRSAAESSFWVFTADHHVARHQVAVGRQTLDHVADLTMTG